MGGGRGLISHSLPLSHYVARAVGRNHKSYILLFSRCYNTCSLFTIILLLKILSIIFLSSSLSVGSQTESHQSYANTKHKLEDNYTELFQNY